MAAGSFVFRTLQSPLDMASVSSRIDGPVAVIGDVHGQTGKLKQYVTVGEALLNTRESGEDP